MEISLIVDSVVWRMVNGWLRFAKSLAAAEGLRG